MNKFKSFLLDADSARRNAENRETRFKHAVPIAIIGLILIFTAQAQNAAPIKFSLTPASDTIAESLPDTTDGVGVFSKEEIRGVDILDLTAERLVADTIFTVLLTELPRPQVVALDYFGDFTTNAAGRGSSRVDAIVEEAFSSTFVAGDRFRKELNHLVIWFAAAADDDFCPVPGSCVTTPLDEDGRAGIAVFSSRALLPGAQLP